jgi:hypothetical protein
MKTGMVKMTKEIPLSRGLKALVDDEDYELVSRFPWRAMRASDGKFYAIGNPSIKGGVPRKTVYMHRIILNPPRGMESDHINGDRLDNRRCNLRVCTRQQNQFNRHPSRGKYSMFKGVFFYKTTGKWMATITMNGKREYLGIFSSETDAAMVYNKRAIELFGEFAKLNDVSI